jgi:Tol biopolymer transport system component
VVFESLAANLTLLDFNSARDVFLRDLATGTTERLSDAPGADQVGADSRSADVSHDGRLVVFMSEATNLIPGDVWAGPEQVFLRDRQRGITTRVSRDLASLGLNTPSAPRIAANGEYVLFEARASPSERALVRYDARTGTLDVVGRYPLAGGSSQRTTHAISDDGRRVAFDSVLPLLMPGTALGSPEVYRADVRPGSLAFATPEVRVDEAAGSVTVEVQRTGGSDGSVTVWATFERSAATDVALPNWDYASFATDGGWLLSWPVGDATPRALVVPIVSDVRSEGDEHLRLRLSEPTGGVAIGTVDEVEIVIDDDD